MEYFFLETSVDGVLQTPAVIAGLFTIIGIFITKAFDEIKTRRVKTEDQLDKAVLARDTQQSKEREDFLNEQHEFRREMTEQMRILREEVNQLRAENVQLRAENLSLNLNYRDSERIRNELKDKVKVLEIQLEELKNKIQAMKDTL